MRADGDMRLSACTCTCLRTRATYDAEQLQPHRGRRRPRQLQTGDVRRHRPSCAPLPLAAALVLLLVLGLGAAAGPLGAGEAMEEMLVSESRVVDQLERGKGGALDPAAAAACQPRNTSTSEPPGAGSCPPIAARSLVEPPSPAARFAYGRHVFALGAVGFVAYPELWLLDLCSGRWRLLERSDAWRRSEPQVAVDAAGRRAFVYGGRVGLAFGEVIDVHFLEIGQNLFLNDLLEIDLAAFEERGQLAYRRRAPGVFAGVSIGRCQGVAAFFNGKFYFGLGLGHTPRVAVGRPPYYTRPVDLYAYDPAADAWSEVAGDGPEAARYGRQRAASALRGSLLYVLGSTRELGDVLEVGPGWEPAPELLSLDLAAPGPQQWAAAEVAGWEGRQRPGAVAFFCGPHLYALAGGGGARGALRVDVTARPLVWQVAAWTNDTEVLAGGFFHGQATGFECGFLALGGSGGLSLGDRCFDYSGQDLAFALHVTNRTAGAGQACRDCGGACSSGYVPSGFRVPPNARLRPKESYWLNLCGAGGPEPTPPPVALGRSRRAAFTAGKVALEARPADGLRRPNASDVEAACAAPPAGACPPLSGRRGPADVPTTADFVFGRHLFTLGGVGEGAAAGEQYGQLWMLDMCAGQWELLSTSDDWARKWPLVAVDKAARRAYVFGGGIGRELPTYAATLDLKGTSLTFSSDLFEIDLHATVFEGRFAYRRRAPALIAGASMGRLGGAAVMYNGNLIVSMGLGHGESQLWPAVGFRADILEYSPARDAWRAVVASGPTAMGRFFPAVALFGSRLFVAGGIKTPCWACGNMDGFWHTANTYVADLAAATPAWSIVNHATPWTFAAPSFLCGSMWYKIGGGSFAHVVNSLFRTDLSVEAPRWEGLEWAAASADFQGVVLTTSTSLARSCLAIVHGGQASAFGGRCAGGRGDYVFAVYPEQGPPGAAPLYPRNPDINVCAGPDVPPWNASLAPPAPSSPSVWERLCEPGGDLDADYALYAPVSDEPPDEPDEGAWDGLLLGVLALALALAAAGLLLCRRWSAAADERRLLREKLAAGRGGATPVETPSQAGILLRTLGTTAAPFRRLVARLFGYTPIPGDDAASSPGEPGARSGRKEKGAGYGDEEEAGSRRESSSSSSSSAEEDAPFPTNPWNTPREPLAARARLVEGDGTPGGRGPSPAPPRLPSGLSAALAQPVSLLGEGAFGRVHAVVLSPEHAPWLRSRPIPPERLAGARRGQVDLVCVAVKEVALADADIAMHEAHGARIQRACRHRNIVPIEAIYRDRLKLYIVMPVAELSLERFIADRGVLPEPTALSFAAQIAAGMEHLHHGMGADPIAHRDLKPQNVLLYREAGTLVPRVCDFGFSRHLRTAVSLRGTLAYLPPETLTNYSPTKADVWAYALIVMEMFTGAKPYAAAGSNQAPMTGEQLGQGRPPYPAEAFGLVPRTVKGTLAACLCPNPQQRPDFREIREAFQGAVEGRVARQHSGTAPASTRDRYNLGKG